MKHQHLFLTLFSMLMLSIWPVENYAQRKNAQPHQPEVITTNISGLGTEIIITVTPGESHNHPMMSVWTEDTAGNYIQTLYVNESVAKGFFHYADNSEGKWMPGPMIRPSALPVWAFKRGIRSVDGHYMPTQDQPIPDAFTSATPQADFILQTKTDKPVTGKFKILFEVNQSWDWNGFWTNDKFPDDEDYSSSAQPSVIYCAEIDPRISDSVYRMKPVGHGHPSGSNGNLNRDLSTITTALDIYREITVKIIR
ncbi:MAG: hypothetical protein EOM06_03670 [Sphingobacteriia bacterium]|nr:hypothetical protein [Sphingobacteriia bacterium]